MLKWAVEVYEILVAGGGSAGSSNNDSAHVHRLSY